MTDTERLLRLAKVRRLAASGEAQAVRERARLTVPEIAAVVGVTESAVSRWEGGSRKPTGEPALRYLALLEALASETENKPEEVSA